MEEDEEEVIIEKDIWNSKKVGKYTELHSEIRLGFTIKKNNYKMGNFEKIALCKTSKCPAKCKVTLYGQSKGHCELFENQYSHLKNVL